jgi:hypothetical protein
MANARKRYADRAGGLSNSSRRDGGPPPGGVLGLHSRGRGRVTTISVIRVEGVVCHIDHSLETPEGDSHENMQLGPQSRNNQSGTRNGEVDVEAHAFCNRLSRPCEPEAVDNRGSLVEETQAFSVEDNRMGNGYHGGEADNLERDTLHDKGDTRGCGEGGLHNHAADEFYQSKNRRQQGCGV